VLSAELGGAALFAFPVVSRIPLVILFWYPKSAGDETLKSPLSFVSSINTIQLTLGEFCIRLILKM
jgi:hypothetical protein